MSTGYKKLLIWSLTRAASTSGTVYCVRAGPSVVIKRLRTRPGSGNRGPASVMGRRQGLLGLAGRSPVQRVSIGGMRSVLPLPRALAAPPALLPRGTLPLQIGLKTLLRKSFSQAGIWFCESRASLSLVGPGCGHVGWRGRGDGVPLHILIRAVLRLSLRGGERPLPMLVLKSILYCFFVSVCGEKYRCVKSLSSATRCSLHGLAWGSLVRPACVCDV